MRTRCSWVLVLASLSSCGGPVRDADEADAGLSTPKCFEPANVDRVGIGSIISGQVQGCPCAEGDAPPGGMCVDGIAMFCEGERWLAGWDGPCVPLNWGQPASCFSPDLGVREYAVPGCACEGSIVNRNGFCVDSLSQAMVCEEGQWKRVVGGPCSDPPIISAGFCSLEGGTASAPAAVPLELWSIPQMCPAGQRLIGAVTRAQEGDAGVAGHVPCCKRL